MQLRSETHYARSGETTIAYQVVGDGPIDLVLVSSWITNVEENWDEPSYARLLTRLASFTRLILFDKRGTGLSDRAVALPTLEERMDDVRAVMDAAGSRQAVLFGSTEGGAICALFAATYPERTAALIAYGAYAKRIKSPDYPWGPSEEERQTFYDALAEQWGGPAVLEYLAPGKVGDESFCRWWAGYLRRSASPGAALHLTQMNSEIDIRRVLGSIRVPTLVLHRTGDPLCPVEGGRFLAGQIPGAKLVELPGIDHLPFVGDVDAIVDAVHEFLTGAPAVVEVDRVLATLLCADIVGSTHQASELGDRRWQCLLEAYHRAVQQQLDRFRGEERGTSGDGFLASFDGPARAIRCAAAIREAVAPLGIAVRAGIHTGECEQQAGAVSGIALHIAARVAALARPGEVLVSGTVKDLVVGSELRFEERGRHTLKGVPGVWRLFAVAPGAEQLPHA
jgi:pimeloyl-ACP methyl ester carboxylesterase/class 3 adenylate cyclase